jgi:hypothetical protein
MITAQSQAGIGGPRPHLSGLSATVTGLQQPASSKWAEVYSSNRFGSPPAAAAGAKYYTPGRFYPVGGFAAAGGFKAFLSAIRSGIIGGGIQ